MSTVGESSRSAVRANSDSEVDTTNPADDHEAVQGGADITAQRSSQQEFVDGKKLNEILELLRSQLESQ